MMKKWLSGLMALAMLLTVCVGCGNNNTTNTGNTGDADQTVQGAEIADGIYYDITGIHADETVMTINGTEIPSEQYFYWLAYTCSNLEYNILSYYNYYGYYAQLVDPATNSLLWDSAEPFYDDMTLAQLALSEAESTLLFYTMLEQAAETYGAQPDEDDQAALEASYQEAIVELGGQEGFEAYLKKLGVSDGYFRQLSRSGCLFDNLLEQVLTPGSQLYLADEGYNDYATYADHILLATVDLTTNEALSEEEIQAQYALAEDLLAQLNAAADGERMELFAQLADQYSEDTGRAANPEGYIYTPGTMVTEFEDAASALQPGQVSGIVETTYGYHIILRKDLPQALAADSEQKSALAEEHLSIVLTQMGEAAQVERAAALDTVDLNTFYTRYTEILMAMSAEEAANASDSQQAAE